MTNYGPWKIWNGGECHVDDHVMVQFQVRSETRFTAEADRTERAGDCGWEWGNDENNYGDIIAYREVIEPEVVVWNGHWDKSQWQLTNLHTGQPSCRNIRITMQGDDIKAEWVE